MYAIIETGGKQYRVAQGDLLQVELLDPGAEKVTFQEVRLLSNGQDTVLGTPSVEGASVTGKVVSTGRLPKILVFKKKRRKHYKRTIGHRQYFTAVRIETIDAAGKIKPLETKAAKKTSQATTARKSPAKKAAPKKKAAPVKAAGKKTAGKKTATKKAPARKAAGASAAGTKKVTKKTTKKKTATAKKATSK
jgi:large subunit ribosomal protein L21